MPSFSKLLAWSALMTIALGLVAQDSDHLNDFEERDLHITITTDEGTLSSESSFLNCRIQCKADGAIGGVVEGNQGCQCAYSEPRFRVQNHGVHSRLVAQECKPNVCNEVCYQEGDFTGGICHDSGSCECQRPKEMSPKEMSPLSEGPCNTYLDCGLCIVYERCCFHGRCACGTTGRESICT